MPRIITGSPVLASLLVDRPTRHALKGLPAAAARWIRSGLEQFEVGASSIGHVKLSLREARPKEDWVALGGIVTDLPASNRYLIILDEFPIFVSTLFKRSEELGTRFLQWFRATRQSLDRIHFLLGGSINLESSLAHRGLSALLNDLEIFRLRPFNSDVSTNFVTDLLLGKFADTPGDIVNNVASEVCSVVGQGVPFYLQLVTSHVVDAIRIEGASMNAEMVQAVYKEKILGPDCRTRFDHYRSRLKDYYEPDDETRARIILHILADGINHDEGDVLDELKKYGLGAKGEDVLAQLEIDYYLERRNGKVRFLHRILADWWRVNILEPVRSGS